MSRSRNGRIAKIAVATAGVAGLVAAGAFIAPTLANATTSSSTVIINNSANTSTPIKHVVVLFDENISFDHYFGTYPKAANTDGVPFTAAKGTPKVTNYESDPSLLTNNPNIYNPSRIPSTDPITCDQNHNDVPEQLAVNNGAMDKFVQNTNNDTNCTVGTATPFTDPGLVMDYYDGNTVSSLWNLAQNYSMSDNSWDTVFGPSTPGALNLVSGQTGGATSYPSTNTDASNPTANPIKNTYVNGKIANPIPSPSPSGPTTTTTSSITAPIGSANVDGTGTLYGDNDPLYDDCSDSGHTSSGPLVALSGKNIGDLLNSKGVSWGWFQGGFAPTVTAAASASGYAQCGSTTNNANGVAEADYSAHHNPFEYYASTANPHHLAPATGAEVGNAGTANHQYDLSNFNDIFTNTAINGVVPTLPAVSLLKAPEAQDGHAGYSGPVDEQKFITNTVNEIEASKYWSSTAIIINYDDSDGWYDQVAPTIINGSADATVGDAAVCANPVAAGKQPLNGEEDRCGPSQRIPLLVISPYAKQNYVSHVETNQASVLQFIENNWSTGRIGGGSFDATAGSLNDMFSFAAPQQRAIQLSTTAATYGKVASVKKVAVAPVKEATKTRISESTNWQTYSKSSAKLTATVTGTPVVPAGVVSFYDGSAKLANVRVSGGKAAYTLRRSLKVGRHTFDAVFTPSSTEWAASKSSKVAVTVKALPKPAKKK